MANLSHVYSFDSFLGVSVITDSLVVRFVSRSSMNVEFVELLNWLRLPKLA